MFICSVQKIILKKIFSETVELSGGLYNFLDAIFRMDLKIKLEKKLMLHSRVMLLIFYIMEIIYQPIF